jgi:acetyltransferase-like isoleucine patch superfamily enzyme
MRLLEKMYRSPLGRIMSMVASGYGKLQRPFMVYGFRDPVSGSFRKYTRMSSSVFINCRETLSVADKVWVWHYSILDAAEGLTLEEGCQIGAWVGLFTHGSEIAIRLLGPRFVDIHNTQRAGYTRGAVRIGAYTFVGAGSSVLPGVNVGKGCLIGAGSLVTKDVPDYSIVVGSPAQVKGSTVDLDKKFFKDDDFSDTYYDKQALSLIQQKLAAERGE